MSLHELMQILGPDTCKQMIRDADAENEAVNGICCEPGDCFVCEEDREPQLEVSLTDDIPDRYFAGIAMPNPISQQDEE